MGIIARSIAAAPFAAALAAGAATAAWSQAATVAIEGAEVYPESISSTSDGTLYIGSLGTGSVLRAAPGATSAEPFIDKDANGLRMVVGVLADEASSTLWVCNAVLGPDAASAPPSELKSFDLASGAAKGTYAFEAGRSLCNDIAVGPDGMVYATDTPNARIYRLQPGGTELENWYTGGEELNGIDGLAFGPGGGLYVNNVRQGTILRLDINADGSPGALTPITLPAPLEGPDGMRTAADGNLWVTENRNGHLTKVIVDGDTATTEVVADGLGQVTGVTQVGNTVWTVESKLAYFVGDKKGQDPGAFTVIPHEVTE